MTQSDGLMLARLGGDAKILCKRTWWVFRVGGIAGVGFGAAHLPSPWPGNVKLLSNEPQSLEVTPFAVELL